MTPDPMPELAELAELSTTIAGAGDFLADVERLADWFGMTPRKALLVMIGALDNNAGAIPR